MKNDKKIQGKILIFFAGLFLFGCATQAQVKQREIEKPVPVHCYPNVAKEFLRWNKSNGKVLNGLTKRRQEEMKLFMRGCPQ